MSVGNRPKRGVVPGSSFGRATDEGGDDDDAAKFAEWVGRGALVRGWRDLNATPRPALLAGCVVVADESPLATPVL